MNKNLIGPYRLLKSGPVDLEAGTITLPLYKGKIKATSTPVWYVLTDVSDKAIADALGLNFSAKLKYAYVPGKHTARLATSEPNGTLSFADGTVDFSQVRSLVPGDAPNYFPPKSFVPGSVGDDNYSPIVHVEDQGVSYNAPIIAYGVDDKDIAFCDGSPDYAKVHDKVVKICPTDGTVTLKLTTGFSFGRPVLYLTTDSNSPLAATLEEATLSPGLGQIHVGGDDGAFSAVERLFSFVNGPQNDKGVNPQRQGLNSAIKDGGGPLNVLGGIPTIATDYSPLWDFNLGEWTQDAIAKGYRSRVNEEFQILGLVKRGFITGPGGGKWGSTGIIVNCPIVHRFLLPLLPQT